MRSDSPAQRGSRPLAAFGLVVLGLIAYCNIFSCPFLFDDATAIVQNPHVRHIWPLSQSMRAPPDTTAAGRPILCLSLAVNYAISGFNVWSYHALNLAVHLLTGLILFEIVRRTFSSERFSNSLRHGAMPIAWCAAALWLVHPLQTESVTYVIQRAEGLMGYFFLLTLYAIIRSADAPKPLHWHVVAVAACALGMGSKEVMATAPALVLLYDAIFLSPSLWEAIRRRRLVYAAMASTWLILAALVVQGPRGRTTGFGLTNLRPWEYAATQPGVVLHYLRLAFWPHPLCLDYGWPIATTARQIAPAATMIGLLGLATAWALLNRRSIGFAGAWFFVILLPTCVVPILDEVAVEHRMYLPLAALCALSAAFIWTALGGMSSRPTGSDRHPGPAFYFVTTLLVGSLLIITLRRNAVYRTVHSVWEDVVRQRPDNPRGHNNFGVALYDEGSLEEAARQFHLALALRPDYGDAHFNLGTYLCRLGRVDEARAEYRQAKLNTSRDGVGYYNLGMTLLGKGRIDEAIKDLQQAVQIEPNSAVSEQGLALAFNAMGRDDKALAHLRSAIRLSPNWPLALKKAAWILATTPHESLRLPPEAIRLATRACELTRYGDIESLDVLAAAYASGGQYKKAMTTAQAAIDRLDPASPLAEGIRSRAELYGRGKPYVAPRSQAVGP